MIPPQVAEITAPQRLSLFEPPSWSADSAPGRLFAEPTAARSESALRRHCLATAEGVLGELAAALGLLPERERERAALLLAFGEALFAAAESEADLETRVADLNRIAFRLARALRGEGGDAGFAGLFAAEARRRGFTRQALDELFAAARDAARAPRPATPEALEIRSRQIAEAFATALFGVEPSAATIELGTGLLRLGRLQRLARDLERKFASLPESELPEPLQYRSAEELALAVQLECGRLRSLLLKGARAAGEVPLTFRRPTVFLLAIALTLLGAIEERPLEVARRAPRAGRWALRRAIWRARFTPLG